MTARKFVSLTSGQPTQYQVQFHDLIGQGEVAPANPAFGFQVSWVDSTSGVWSVKDNTGTIWTPILQGQTGSAHQFVIGTGTTGGALTYGQPDFSDLTGSATAGQLPALNGITAPTADVSLNGHKITSLADPIGNQDAVNLQTLLSYLNDQDSKTECAYAAAAALPTNNYANGSSGVGATLTATTNGPLVVDGITTVLAAVGQRFLIGYEGTGSHNGIYTLTQQGIALVQPWILTRATDFDQPAEINPGDIVPVKAPSGLSAGLTNDGKVFITVAPNPFTVGSDTATFSVVGNTYSAGIGLTLTGTTFSVNYGSTATTACVGNDARLSDARTPVGTALTSAQIWVGNASNLAAAVATSGDVTVNNAGVFAIGNNKVTLGMMATISTATLLGRNTAATGNVEDLSMATVVTMLNTQGGITAGPAGSTTQFQYNNAGTMAGAANFTYVSNVPTFVIEAAHTAITTPSTPSAGNKVYAKARANKVHLNVLDLNGVEDPLGAHRGHKIVMEVRPLSGATISMIGVATTINGTASTPVITTTNLRTSTIRTLFTSLTSANANGGFVTASTETYCWRGNGAGLGGFYAVFRFAQEVSTNGARAFIGLGTATSVIAGSNIAANANHLIGMGYDDTDAPGNWFIMRSDATLGPTRVDLGSGAARNTTDVYELVIYCKPNDTVMYVRVTNLSTATIVLDTSYSTLIPTTTDLLAFNVAISAAASGVAQKLNHYLTYIEVP